MLGYAFPFVSTDGGCDLREDEGYDAYDGLEETQENERTEEVPNNSLAVGSARHVGACGGDRLSARAAVSDLWKPF